MTHQNSDSGEVPGLESQDWRDARDEILIPKPGWKWFWMGLFIAAAPLLIPYFLGMWNDVTYRYIPFAIGASIWLAYQRSDGYFYPPRGVLSWCAIALGLLCIAFSALVQFPWFAAVGFVIFAAVMLYAMRGPDDRSLILVALPLLTVIRLIRVDDLLVRYLQNVTTWMSSVLLDGLAVPHAVANNVIQLSDRELFVAEACSGIQSVFTLAFLSLLVVAFRRRRLWMAPVYIAIACLLAVFANVIRVTTVALAANSFGADLAHGWPHDLIGYIALAMAFGFLLSFDFLIATLMHWIPDDSEENGVIGIWNRVALLPVEEEVGRGTQGGVARLMDEDRRSMTFEWARGAVDNRAWQSVFAVVVGLVTIASLYQVVSSRRPAKLVESDKALVFDPPIDVIESSLRSLEVVSHKANRGYEEPRLGANSDVWECKWKDATIQFVLSQPHKGWHELCDCYERLDWSLLDRQIRDPEEAASTVIEAANRDASESTYVVARFKRDPAQRGYLLFAGIGSDGTLVDAPDSLSAFTHRVWNRIDNTGVWDQSEVLMLQMWVMLPGKLKADELRELEREFVSVRSVLANEIAINANRIVPAKNRSASLETVRTGSGGTVNRAIGREVLQ